MVYNILSSRIDTTSGKILSSDMFGIVKDIGRFHIISQQPL